MGLAVVDAGVLIGFWDASDPHHPAARSSVRDLRVARDRVAVPATALAESLVGVIREGDEALDRVKDFLARFPVEVVHVDEQIAEAAARLRATHGRRLRLPDALVVATALVIEADALLTTDRDWPGGDALGFPGELIIL